MSIQSAQVVLEEVLGAAIEAALEARAKAAGDPIERGQLMAYHDIISVAKEQAALLGLEFRDKNIAAFDPDDLLKPAKRAA